MGCCIFCSLAIITIAPGCFVYLRCCTLTCTDLLPFSLATGGCAHIGITTSSTSQFADMELLMKTKPIDFIQLNYSLKERAAEERLLPLAMERGIAVMVNRPFARGRLFEAFKDESLPAWAADIDCSSWGQFFLKYVVSHPAVTCTIPGTTKESHVRDNMGAIVGRLPGTVMRLQQEALFASL